MLLSTAETMALARLACFLLLALFAGCSAYYVPGTYPQEFEVGNQLQGALPTVSPSKLPFTCPRTRVSNVWGAMHANVVTRPDIVAWLASTVLLSLVLESSQLLVCLECLCMQFSPLPELRVAGIVIHQYGQWHQ